MRHLLLTLCLLGAQGSAMAETAPYRVAVQMEQDRRATPDDFAKRQGMARAELQRRFGATGLVRCGSAVGTAQLTLRNDLITTAAHVLIGPDGAPRRGCRFEPKLGASAVAIDMASLKAGSRRPLAEPATRDWAVARLAAPVAGAVPYRLAPASALPASVTMFAGGNHSPTAMGAEECRARHVISTATTGVREVAIDCSAAPGSSGAAVMAGHAIAAIYVGYRSTHPNAPQAFSEQHYNFAITVDGPFRQAVLAAAR
jgi:hypothetical protein